MFRIALLCTVLATFVACANDAEDSDGDEFTQPTALFVKDEQGCVAERPSLESAALLESREAQDELIAVEVFRIEECSGAGGTHLLAREPEGSRTFWIGQHACTLTDTAILAEPVDGVVMGRQTAALFTPQEGWCINFPGATETFTTSHATEAVFVFDSAADAKSFASTP